MKAFGDRLKQARAAKGVSVRDVAASTRISERYLLALEHSDQEALPGGVFAKGYIKSYAELLGIDPKPILDAYDAQERERGRGTPEDERKKLEELARLVDAHPATGVATGFNLRHVLVATVGLAVAVMVFGGVWFVARSPTRVSAPPPIAGHPVVPRSPPSPQAAPEPLEDEPAAPVSSQLRIPQAGVGAGVVERNLVGRNDRFAEGEKIWFWTRVVGGKQGDRIRHVWMRGGRTYMDAELRIGADHWRTYTTLVLEPGSAGEWSVEARTADGRVLAREEFLCLSPHDGT